MTPGQPSETARFVSVQRAHHALFAPEPKLLRDDLAMRIAGLPDASAVEAAIEGLIAGFAQLGDRETAAAFVRQIEHAVCVRSRLVEHRLEQRRGSNLAQLVILGAGLDTLAYRRPDLTEGLAVFEIDHPDTQAGKRSSLAQAAIAVPDNLSFAPFDFEQETLAQALRASGINAGLPTMFTWLGVHMYLPDDAVRTTLEALGGFAMGSELVMDFVPEEDPELSREVEQSITELRRMVEQMGEPIKSRYTPQALEARLVDAGFMDVEFWDGARIVETFLCGEDSAFSMPAQAVSTLVATI